MLWTIFVVLLVLWLLGLVTSYTFGGFVHILLVLALVVLVIQLFQGRRVVDQTKSGRYDCRWSIPYSQTWRISRDLWILTASCSWTRKC